MATCSSPVRHVSRPKATPFDLHALGTPPALILSQDQTLHQCHPIRPSGSPPVGDVPWVGPRVDLSMCCCGRPRSAAHGLRPTRPPFRTAPPGSGQPRPAGASASPCSFSVTRSPSVTLLRLPHTTSPGIQRLRPRSPANSPPPTSHPSSLCSLVKVPPIDYSLGTSSPCIAAGRKSLAPLPGLLDRLM